MTSKKQKVYRRPQNGERQMAGRHETGAANTIGGISNNEVKFFGVRYRRAPGSPSSRRESTFQVSYPKMIWFISRMD
jgi:hypothetical protein